MIDDVIDHLLWNSIESLKGKIQFDTNQT